MHGSRSHGWSPMGWKWPRPRCLLGTRLHSLIKRDRIALQARDRRQRRLRLLPSLCARVGVRLRGGLIVRRVHLGRFRRLVVVWVSLLYAEGPERVSALGLLPR